MSKFIIPTSVQSSRLTFSNFVGEDFDFELRTSKICVSRKVNAFYPPEQTLDGVATYFEKLASFALPWSDDQIWEAMCGELTFTASCNSAAHVQLKVAVSEFSRLETWNVSCDVVLEFGALEEIAIEARHFFGGA